MTEDAEQLRQRVRDLEAQLDEQEEQIEQQQTLLQKMMPGRRDVLGAAGGAVAGGGLASLLTGSASAGTGQAGTIGSQSGPADVFAEDFFDKNGNKVFEFLGSGDIDSVTVGTVDNAGSAITVNDDLDASGQSVTTDEVTANHGLVRGRNSERSDASKFDGADADARLDAALSAASSGDTIYLENDTYSSNRTISSRVCLIGTMSGNAGTSIEADWTLDGRVCIYRVADAASNGSFTINGFLSGIFKSDLGATTSVTVAADDFRFLGNRGADVTFNSGTSGGLVDSCADTTTTDNGTNTVGDIA